MQVWEKVKDLLTKINLKSPFKMEAALLLEKIGYFLMGIWIVGTIAENYVQWLSKSIGKSLIDVKIDFNYLFIAGIVYIISQVFKRGVEIQNENELTV